MATNFVDGCDKKIQASLGEMMGTMILVYTVLTVTTIEVCNLGRAEGESAGAGAGVIQRVGGWGIEVRCFFFWIAWKIILKM